MESAGAGDSEGTSANKSVEFVDREYLAEAIASGNMRFLRTIPICMLIMLRDHRVPGPSVRRTLSYYC